MINMNKKVVVISGPTASGKTALAVFLAKKFSGEIISADSRQVYRDLDLGTGKDLGEYGKVKYHLIDICDPGEKFTLFDWLKLARKKIDEISQKGKLPIVVGGTGLYVKALVEGYEITRIKNKELKIKKYSRRFLDNQSTQKLTEILKKLNPSALEKIDLKNPRRLVRAIELAQEKSEINKTKPDLEFLQIAIDLPRDELYKRIDLRANRRFEQGMLEEVENLIKKGVSKKWLLSLGLEYKIIGQYALELRIKNKELRSNKTVLFDQMVQDLKWKSHAYARRQLTWLRHQPNITWVKKSTEAAKIAKNFLK